MSLINQCVVVQAYTVELEVELNQLKEENEKLKKNLVIKSDLLPCSISTAAAFIRLLHNTISPSYTLRLFTQADGERKRRKEVKFFV